MDPIGFAAGDPNLYRYAGNAPTYLVDPSGLASEGDPGQERAYPANPITDEYTLTKNKYDVLYDSGLNDDQIRFGLAIGWDLNDFAAYILSGMGINFIRSHPADDLEVDDEGPGPDKSLDSLQAVLDYLGIADPTPITDLVNGALYALRGKFSDSVFTLLGVVHYLGDLAKGGKALGKRIKAAEDAGEAVADVAKAVAPSNRLSPRAARRQAMRDADIPTSQQPVSQKSVRTSEQQPAGRQYTYETPKPGGVTTTNSVQHSLTDQVEGHGPHWEAGPVKPGGQVDSLRQNGPAFKMERLRLTNERKYSIDYSNTS